MWPPLGPAVPADSTSGPGADRAPQLGRRPVRSAGRTLHADAVNRPLGRPQQHREAVLLAFCEPVPAQCASLRHLSAGEWKRLARWLDTSGLALYFLDRIAELELCEMLPPAVLRRLQQSLRDNTARTSAMVAESAAIQLAFQQAGLSYAVLKGFSLWPVSVPKLELRSQLDLDFLIAEACAAEARRILEARGYRLHAISGRSWEFKAVHEGAHSLKDLYKATPHRAVELHIEAASAECVSLLSRVERRSLHGIWMPVLSPADLFLGQGLHAYKHVCSEFSRTAHLLEFRRHVIARYHDDAFWKELREIADGNPRAPIGLGLLTLLISHVMGDFAPEALTCWTVDRLPAAARLWVEMYGSRAAICSVPGSKLYLLLQQVLEQAGVPARRSLRQALLPRRLPPAIAHGTPGESIFARIRRYRKQLHFILFRLRFHVVEGLRYLRESVRWRRQIARITR
jgi:hypothetical protein